MLSRFVMLTASPMAGPHPEMPVPETPTSLPVDLGQFGGGRLCSGEIEVRANYMRAFLRHAMRHGLADAVARADDNHHAALHLALGGHAFQLGLFEQPVFNVERLLLRKRHVLVDRLRAAHHLNGAVVELSRDARFTFIFFPNAIMPTPGIRITVGFASRIFGESGCLYTSRSRRRSPCGIAQVPRRSLISGPRHPPPEGSTPRTSA